MVFGVEVEFVESGLYLEAIAKIVVIKNGPDCWREETFRAEVEAISKMGMNGRHFSTNLHRRLGDRTIVS